MRIPKYLTTAILVTTIALPSAVFAFRAQNAFEVNQVDQNTFEVIPGRSRVKDAYWCAAGDYARRQLGLDWREQLYVVTGYTDSVTTGRKSAVQFTANPEGAGVIPYEASFVGDILTVGYSRSVSEAFNRCRGSFKLIDR